MGAEEESDKTMRGNVKVYKDPEKAKFKPAPSDVILLWMIRWAAMTYSRFEVGSDGETAYERLTGRKCRLEVGPFGEHDITSSLIKLEIQSWKRRENCI